MLETEDDKCLMARLQEGIFKLFGKVVDYYDEELVESYVEFYRYEIEGEPIQDYVTSILAEPIRSNSLGYRDENDDFNVVCHLYYLGPNPYEIWMENGEVIKNPLEQPKFV